MKQFSNLFSKLLFATFVGTVTAFTGVGAMVAGIACPVAFYGNLATAGVGLTVKDDGNFINPFKDDSLQILQNNTTKAFCGEGNTLLDSGGNRQITNGVGCGINAVLGAGTIALEYYGLKTLPKPNLTNTVDNLADDLLKQTDNLADDLAKTCLSKINKIDWWEIQVMAATNCNPATMLDSATKRLDILTVKKDGKFTGIEGLKQDIAKAPIIVNGKYQNHAQKIVEAYNGFDKDIAKIQNELGKNLKNQDDTDTLKALLTDIQSRKNLFVKTLKDEGIEVSDVFEADAYVRNLKASE